MLPETVDNKINLYIPLQSTICLTNQLVIVNIGYVANHGQMDGSDFHWTGYLTGLHISNEQGGP